MLGQTIRLFIKALIIGVLINLSIQQVSTSPLPYPENSALHNQEIDQTPANAKFQVTNQAEK